MFKLIIPLLLYGFVSMIQNLDAEKGIPGVTPENKTQRIKDHSESADSIDIYYQLADDLRDINDTLAEIKARHGISISQRLKSNENIVRGLQKLGTIKLIRGEYVEADSLYNQALRQVKHNNQEVLAEIYNGLGFIQFVLAEFSTAYDYFRKSLEISLNIKNDSLKAKYNLNIGIIYSETGDYDNALKMFHELKDYFESENDTFRLIQIYNDIGGVYLKIFKKDRASINKTQSSLDSAEFYCTKSLKLSENSSTTKTDIIQPLINIGQVFSHRNLLNESNELLLKALALADNPQYQSDIDSILRNNYFILGDTLKAYYYDHQYNKNVKELRKEETAKIQAKRKFEEQSKISKTNKKLLYFALVCLLISLLFIVTLYFNFRIKKRANRLLTELDELKSRLFSNLTHEFRTPLTLILGPLDEMLSEGEKRNLTRHEFKIMQKNARRLLNLVNQMLDLAKLDAKSMKAELTEGDFVKFFKINVQSFSTVAEQKGIVFKWMVPKDPLITWFDEDKLEKIINNLVSNAIKYTGKGGEINCILETVPGKLDMVKFWIADTGKGIRKEYLPRIFDRFYQVDGMLGPDSFGTGIGLSLTKELITLLKGAIVAESGWGTGSKFTVTLPLGFRHLNENEYVLVDKNKTDKPKPFMQDAWEQEKSTDADIELVLKKKINLPLVLTVEDQADIRNFITEHLKDYFRILEADNGQDGYELAIKCLPDLVITDLVMPGMDGIELCRKLKTAEHTGHIPVIMLTARTGTEERLESLETGADQYLTKPFQMRELLLLVRKLIEQRNLLRERFSRDVRLEPKDIAITPADEKFLNRALAVIETHMGDFDFEVNIFQEEMAMSRMQLFRKIKALTDMSPTEFIRTIRLKRAIRLIENDFGNIAQISYEVGFNNPSYFAKCFKEKYGCQPSDYKRQQHSN